MTEKTELTHPENFSLDTRMSPATLRALLALKNGKVPPEKIKQHPGKGGKTFSYVSHIFATNIMNDAFNQQWDYDVLETAVYPDKSAMARCRLTLHIPYEDGSDVLKFHTRTITEIGAKDAVDGMSSAMMVASAASRALLKCMLRAFGFGSELYKDDDSEMTPASAYKTILDWAIKHKLTEEDVKAALKEAGIADKSKMVDQFEKAYEVIYNLVEERKQK